MCMKDLNLPADLTTESKHKVVKLISNIKYLGKGHGMSCNGITREKRVEIDVVRTVIFFYNYYFILMDITRCYETKQFARKFVGFT